MRLLSIPVAVLQLALIAGATYIVHRLLQDRDDDE